MSNFNLSAGLGLEAGERNVWAPPPLGAGAGWLGGTAPPRQAARDFNPWTARHPLQEFIAPSKNEWVTQRYSYSAT